MLLNDIVELNGSKYPDRVAMVAPQGTLTFGQLRDRMHQVANAMAQLAEPGDRIAILAENLPEYVECYYGVPAAGMALTFLNYRLHPKEWASSRPSWSSSNRCWRPSPRCATSS